MTIIDPIAEERRRYLSSARTKQDWFRYVTAVERLRKLALQQSQRGDEQPDH
jgi:hypothetical protein